MEADYPNFSSLIAGDLVIIAAAVIVVAFLARQYRTLKQFGTPLGLLTTVSAFLFAGLFAFVELQFTAVLPLFGERDRAAALFEFYQHTVGGPLIIVCLILLLVGFVLTMKWFTKLVLRLDQTRGDLEGELENRTRLENELYAALEKAEAANKAKSEFLATVSHEVRTPLNGIIGFTQVLLMRDLDHESQSHLKLIRRSSDTLLEILNDILDVSKIEAGQMELEVRAFDFVRMIRGFEDFWSGQFDGLVDFEVMVQPDMETALIGDEMRVRQIVDNLVSNAKKFTENGRVNVSFEGERDGENYRLSISVKDTGIGLTPREQAKIFEPFMQADQSTTREYGGSGLGLTICRSLARQMGGDISATSEAGKGSTFKVELSLMRAAKTQHHRTG